MTVASGIVAGFALLAAVNAVAIAVALPLPVLGYPLRIAHHLFDAAETLGLGALVALVVGAFVRFVPLPRWALSTLTIGLTGAIVYFAIGEPLTRIASHAAGGRFLTPIFLGYIALFAVGFSEALSAAIFLSTRASRVRFAPVAFAIALLAADQGFLVDDYEGVHCVVAWFGALIGGAGLAPFAARAAALLLQRRSGRVVLCVAALGALLGLAWPPSNATRFELFRQPCALAPWLLARTLWRSPPLHAPVSLPASPWNADRTNEPDLPATSARPLPTDAVVVLITIDALRADAILDPANDALFPTFAALKREGAVFTHAFAAGTQTSISLSTVFSDLYFSEERWENHGVGDTRYLFPAGDRSPRFPQLLTEGGVRTVDYAGLFFLSAGYGVAEGFQEQEIVVKGRRHAAAGEVIAPLVARLQHPDGGPLFLFTHLLDPHRPYDRGRKDGTDYERYLSEVAIADAALGQVVRALEQNLGQRWALFVSADHGEAFGEHRTSEHSKTLYQELLHVPLIVRGPHFAKGAIDTPVSLVDLGPTILELFHLPTPAAFNGQSLVPFLLGPGRRLTRPILAEGRLRRALIEPDGFKVIEDPRRKLVEAYDLESDPGETRNIFDRAPARADHALAELRAFFAVHTRREGGYEPPYMP
jgi:hypothetical protein